MTNSRLHARRRHAPDDDIEFYFLQVTEFFQSVWMQLGTDVSTLKGLIYSKSNKRIPTTHTTWVYNRARLLAAGCMMVPILVVHSRYSTSISEGVVRERVSDGLYKTPTKVFPAERCLRSQRGNGRLQNYYQWSCPN